MKTSTKKAAPSKKKAAPAAERTARAKKIGRPSSFTQAKADQLCELIVQKWTLRQIEAREDMPGHATILRWLEAFPDFRTQYARAMELRADIMADELLEIADDGRNDWVERENADGSSFMALDHEHVTRSKLRVDARKWLLSKMAPKKYGERVVAEHVGKDGGPIRIAANLSDDELARIAAGSSD